MKKWIFADGLEILEAEHDYNLHIFKCYVGDNYLGSIYPDTVDDMDGIISDLDYGKHPINDGWEDGCGNALSFDGWEN